MSQTDKIKIFWDPKGFELDSVGKKTYLRATDGDTPYISVPIRMLSIDTPEVHYPGNQKPSKHDEKLKQLADWIDEGKAPIKSGLAKHLYPKLVTSEAGTLQETQGEKATDEFKKLLSGKKVSSKYKYGWISRYCADVTNREVFYPQDYFKVEPYNRIFIWPKDIGEAVSKMNLSPP